MARSFNEALAEYLNRAAPVVVAYPFTMAVSFKPLDLVQTQTLVSIGDKDSAAFCALMASGGAAGDPIQARSRLAGAATNASTTTAFVAGVWQRACGVFAASNDRRAFLNGAGKGVNATAITGVETYDSTRIGSRFNLAAGIDFANGELARVIIWNAALSDAEVAEDAAGLLTRPENVIALITLASEQDPEADASGNGNTFALVGAPPSTPDPPEFQRKYPPRPTIASVPEAPHPEPGLFRKTPHRRVAAAAAPATRWRQRGTLYLPEESEPPPLSTIYRHAGEDAPPAGDQTVSVPAISLLLYAEPPVAMADYTVSVPAAELALEATGPVTVQHVSADAPELSLEASTPLFFEPPPADQVVAVDVAELLLEAGEPMPGLIVAPEAAELLLEAEAPAGSLALGPPIRSLAITLNNLFSTELNYDFVRFYDRDDVLIASHHGVSGSNAVVTVPGNFVRIRLTSDSSQQAYGFKVLSINADNGQVGEAPFPESLHPYAAYSTLTWDYEIVDLSGAIAVPPATLTLEASPPTALNKFSNPDAPELALEASPPTPYIGATVPVATLTLNISVPAAQNKFPNTDAPDLALEATAPTPYISATVPAATLTLSATPPTITVMVAVDVPALLLEASDPVLLEAQIIPPEPGGDLTLEAEAPAVIVGDVTPAVPSVELALQAIAPVVVQVIAAPWAELAFEIGAPAVLTTPPTWRVAAGAPQLLLQAIAPRAVLLPEGEEEITVDPWEDIAGGGGDDPDSGVYVPGLPSWLAPYQVLEIEWGGTAGTRFYIDRPLATGFESTGARAPAGSLDRAQEWGTISIALREGQIGSVDSTSVTLWDGDKTIMGHLTETWQQRRSAKIWGMFDHPSCVWPAGRLLLFEGAIVPFSWQEGKQEVVINLEDASRRLTKDVGKIAAKSVFPLVPVDTEDRALPIALGRPQRVEAVLVQRPWETQLLDFTPAEGMPELHVFDHPDTLGVVSGETVTAYLGVDLVEGFFTQSVDPQNVPSTFTITNQPWNARGTVGALWNAEAVIDYRRFVFSTTWIRPKYFDFSRVEDEQEVLCRWIGGAMPPEVFSRKITNVSRELYNTWDWVRVTLDFAIPAYGGSGVELTFVGTFEDNRRPYPPGTRLASADTRHIYLANMLPSEDVQRVEGFGHLLDESGGTVDDFITLNPDGYVVNLDDDRWAADLGHNATTLTFGGAPTGQFNELTENRIWCTLKGMKDEAGGYVDHPADLIYQYLTSPHLLGIPPAKVETVSFDEARAALPEVRFGYAQLEIRKGLDVVQELAAQCHAVVQFHHGVARMVVLHNALPGEPRLTLDESDVDELSLQTAESPISELTSHAVGTWQRDWDDKGGRALNIIRINQAVEDAFGRAVRRLPLNAYYDRELARGEVNFWVARWSRIWEVFTFDTYLTAMLLYPGQWVHLSYTDGEDNVICEDDLEVMAVTYAPGAAGRAPSVKLQARRPKFIY